ncbi:MAG TPA: ornithine cyclodeaminase family protein [candidate division Zixibacteria bacterium]|nr:ornithine cyclodeaminase family protein [candidate division Zixibacteria bacterium]
MRFISGEQMEAAVSPAELLDAVEAAYRDVVAGRDRSPLRTHVALPEGDLLMMPGVRDGGSGSTVKLVTVTPRNADRGLPTVQALVTWFDAASGEPMAVLEGSTLTRMRTGAASGAATRLLARTDATVMAMVGAGGQAAWQVRAVLAARPSIREVRVFARTAERREAFAGEMAGELDGVRVAAVSTAEEAVRGADVVCCATTSSEPVFEAEWLAPGAHVNGVGAYRLGMVEIPPEAFARAALVAVDSREAARAEAGDLMAALGAGLMSEDAVVEIGSVDAGWAEGRDPDAITVFKSVGLAIQDVAAAELILARVSESRGAVRA